MQFDFSLHSLKTITPTSKQPPPHPHHTTISTITTHQSARAGRRRIASYQLIHSIQHHGLASDTFRNNSVLECMASSIHLIGSFTTRHGILVTTPTISASSSWSAPLSSNHHHRITSQLIRYSSKADGADGKVARA